MSSTEITTGAVAILKPHASALGGTCLAWLGVIAANEAQIEIALRWGSFIAAIIASGFTVWDVIRRNRKKKHKQLD